MMPTWLAVLIVIVVGGLLIYWHFSGTQILPRDRRANDNFFDGVSSTGNHEHGFSGTHGESSDAGAAGGDGGGGGGDG